MHAIRFVRAGLAALAVGGLAVALGAAEAAASPSGRPTSAVSMRPNQLTVNQQIKQARIRFAANKEMPHPGKPEALTHPAEDGTGSGLAAHTGSKPASLPAVHRSEVQAGSRQVGLDVSGYQESINWSQVAANGATFAYVKATEGTYYVDSAYFPQQYNGSYDAGLLRGAYHFAIPDNSTGAAQADYFVANGGGWTGDGRTLPGMLDIEYNPYGAECYGLTQSQMVSWITSFDNEYRSLTGRWPDIYTTTDWWSTCTGDSGAFGQETLSLARWSDTPYPLPNGWATYTIWQYADSGIFPGDQDAFNGSHQDLVAFAMGQVNDRIPSGGALLAGQAMMSGNGYKVVMQRDGNLVEYAPDGHPLWATNTNHHAGAYVAMQRDGNLVVYLGHRPLWASNTNRRGSSNAVIQSDANFVIYTASGTATWSSRGGRIK